jgi:DNA-binding IclR family transcriptional regulator
MPRATAYALIRVLLQEGFLDAGSEDGGYVIGRQAYRVGLGYRGDAALLRAARPILAALRDETQETVQLSVLDRDRNLVLHREDGTGRVGFIMPVGSYAPVNWSASGCLLVSDLDDAELRARIGPTVEPSPTGLAPTDMTAVIREIRRFRAQGYGVKIGHANAKVAMIAAPVRDPAGHCTAAITVVAYELSLKDRRRRVLVAAVRRSAAELSARLTAG